MIYPAESSAGFFLQKMWQKVPTSASIIVLNITISVASLDPLNPSHPKRPAIFAATPDRSTGRNERYIMAKTYLVENSAGCLLQKMLRKDPISASITAVNILISVATTNPMVMGAIFVVLGSGVRGTIFGMMRLLSLEARAFLVQICQIKLGRGSNCQAINAWRRRTSILMIVALKSVISAVVPI